MRPAERCHAGRLVEPGLDVEYGCAVDGVELLDLQVEVIDLDQTTARDTSQFNRRMLRWPKMPTSGQSGLSRGRRAPRLRSVGSVRWKRKTGRVASG
jgi:hypothetical protein